jgi:type VI secretion system protein ImpM
MNCSLYGKLPSKRDFVAVRAPRAFLDPWEPWLQSAISSSRNELGEDWQSAFLMAPIWRFWLGSNLCGRSTIGAFMPSLDGVGRYFPLTVFACADDGTSIAPPELDPQESWFAAAETFLMSALDQDMTYDVVSARLDQLIPPAQGGAALPQTGSGVDAAAFAGGGDSLGGTFEALRLRQHDDVYAAASFWWTIGGESYPPRALAAKHMPDPYIFSRMLTGQFAAA